MSGVGGGFDAELTRLRGLGCTQADVVVVVDFDLTLTSGTSDECHDIVGTSALMPKALHMVGIVLHTISEAAAPVASSVGDRAMAELEAHDISDRNRAVYTCHSPEAGRSLVDARRRHLRAVAPSMAFRIDSRPTNFVA